MRKLVFILLTIGLFACNENTNKKNNEKPISQTSISRVDTIYSSILNEQRILYVHSPIAEADDFDPNQQYPVIILLDGKHLFQSFISIARKMSADGGNFSLPKMIVVSIENTDRWRDFTPSHSLDSIDLTLGPNSGGGDQFIAFIEREVIPHINTTYPAAPYRVFMGHSLGGLLVMETMLKHTALFNAYVAIDPSLWWDDQKILFESEKLLQQDYANTSLYLAIANTLIEGITLDNIHGDKRRETRHLRSLLQFERYLKERKGNNLVYQSNYYPDHNHDAVTSIAMRTALPFIFGFYDLGEFPSKDFLDAASDRGEFLKDHYKAVSDKMGYPVLPPGELVDTVARQLLEAKQFERAGAYFQLNIDNYPDSFRSYEGMGDFYAAKKDVPPAKEQYVKALSLSDNEKVRGKLKKL